MLNRILLAGVIGAVAVLQAWDSGVFRAGTPVVGLVLGGIGLLLLAHLVRRTQPFATVVLLVGAALIVVGRLVSPIGLNALGVIFPITVIPYVVLYQRDVQERR